MPDTSAGHLIVDQLEACGVPRAYVVPGESFLDVLDGLHDSPVRTVVCRQEGGAAFMAMAEGRLTDVPGVAMVTRGPGAANALIAVHTAWQDATAMVLFVGLIPRADRGRESFQEFDLHAWFGSTAKKVLVLDDADSAARVVDDAIHTARTGRPGPVVVGLPEDVLRLRTRSTAVSPRPVPRIVPDATAFADRVAAALRPVIIVGGDGWDAAGAAALAGWAAERGIPVAADWRAHDAVPHDSPAFVGTLGYGRSDRLARLVHDADLHVFVGCVRTDVSSDGYTLGADTPTVVVGPDADAVGHFGRIDLQVVATVPEFAAALTSTTGPAPTPPADPARLPAARAAHLEFATPQPDGGLGVDLGEVMQVLRDELPEDTVLTYGAGNHSSWPARFLPRTTARSLVAPRNGAMGFGIPAAVAASLAAPGRPVLSVAGDGCFLMNGQELATAVRHGAAFVVLVVDNGIYGTIVEHQEREYPGRPSGTGMTNPDFAALARSYGAFGERVEKASEFRAAFARARASGRPALLHLLTDPGVLRPAHTET